MAPPISHNNNYYFDAVLQAIGRDTTPEEFDEIRSQYPAYTLKSSGWLYPGLNALHLAAAETNIKLTQHLVNLDPSLLEDVQKAPWNWTSLHRSIIDRRHDFAINLLELGAKINAKTGDHGPRRLYPYLERTPVEATSLWLALDTDAPIDFIVDLLKRGAVAEPGLSAKQEGLLKKAYEQYKEELGKEVARTTSALDAVLESHKVVLNPPELIKMIAEYVGFSSVSY